MGDQGKNFLLTLKQLESFQKKLYNKVIVKIGRKYAFSTLFTV